MCGPYPSIYIFKLTSDQFKMDQGRGLDPLHQNPHRENQTGPPRRPPCETDIISMSSVLHTRVVTGDKVDGDTIAFMSSLKKK